MSINLYDTALLTKFSKWTAGTPAALTGVNDTTRLFEVLSDKKNDKPIQLPLITLSRPGGYSIKNKNKRPLSFNAHTFQITEARGAKVNIIPIEIAYQIDVYARYLAEADEYARNLIFNIVNYPKLTIDIPYENLGIKHDANIRIVSEIEDNSDIPQRLIPGQFTRLTLGINIDDAYLFDVRLHDNVSISDCLISVAE